VERARAGEGPSFLEAKTYRYYDHQGVKGLRIPYRSQEEIDTWLERDAITALEQRLVAADVIAADELEQVWTDTREEIAAAITFAEDSPDPDPAGLLDNVYTV
jgi:TPP-dependent pyruvate/acetoin dehydrogenase alpha subunit